jgi:hypothetical protein
MATNKSRQRRPGQGHVATLENAYRLAARAAEANDRDMQVSATGKPEQPFIAEPANDRRKGVVARILAG